MFLFFRELEACAYHEEEQDVVWTRKGEQKMHTTGNEQNKKVFETNELSTLFLFQTDACKRAHG